jgi:hypothetical protein
MKHSFVFIPIFAILIYCGCKSTSTIDSTTTLPIVVIPNVGSNWMLQNIHSDSSGKVTKTDTSMRVIAQTNMSFQNFTDVVMIVETNLSTKISDTVYLRYLSTGDISRFSAPSIDPQLTQWLTIPYTTHTAQVLNFGGNIAYLGFTHDTISFSAAFSNDDNIVLGAVIYPVSIVISTTSQNATSAVKDSADLITQTNSFIPSKGIFGGRVVSFNAVKGKQIQRVQQTLIGVNLK